MRILHVIMGDIQKGGGLQSVVRNVVNHINEDTIIMFSVPKKVTTVNSKLIPLKVPEGPLSKIIFNLYVIPYLLREQFDIIHCHGMCFTPLLIGRMRGSFTVVTIHGCTAGKEKHLGTHEIISKRLEYLSSKFSHKVIACSKEVKREIMKYYNINEQKICVIYNSADINKFRIMQKKKSRKKLGLPLDKRLVLWVGQNKWRKGFDIAQKVVDELGQDIHLISTVVEDDFKRYIRLGRLPNENMPLLYNSANLLLFPSRYEGHPLVVLEALACGLPVVTSKSSNVEIIENGKQGYIIDSMNANDYIGHTKKILENEELSDIMSKAARKLAEKYSWDEQSRRYFDLYLRGLNIINRR